MRRILLVTAKRAADSAREIAERVRRARGWVIDVAVAPVEVAALIPGRILEKIIAEKAKDYDAIIVPGSLPYDVSTIGRKYDAKIVKGPTDIWGLEILVELDDKDLERLVEEGEWRTEILLEKWLNELRRVHEEASGVEICGVKIPHRPPPVVVIAEIYVRENDRGNVEKALELLDRGADIIVFGFSSAASTSLVERMLREARREGLDGVFGVDTPSLEVAKKALEEGSCILFSIGSWNISWLDKLSQDTAVVVTPVSDNYTVPSAPTERVETLIANTKKALSKGFKVLADPIVDPPGTGLLPVSVTAYFLSSRSIEAPLLAGIANVYELVDADSHGQMAALTQIYVEAGASAILVTEESNKTRMAVSEAAIAATMTSLSLLKKRPPKDLGVSLLYAKEKRTQQASITTPKTVDRVVDAENMAPWQLFRPDRLGSHIIIIRDGVIEDYYIGPRGTMKIRGRRAEDIYKTIAYLGLASEPTHFAYLGYELCKAEHALIMRKSYEQEKPLIAPPWSSNIYYSPRMRTIRKLVE